MLVLMVMIVRRKYGKKYVTNKIGGKLRLIRKYLEIVREDDIKKK